MPNWVIGLIAILVLAVASYVAFTKQVPWGGGTEVRVTFKSAQNLRPNAPVRIAGVEVGKVKDVQPLDPSSTDENASASSGSSQTGAVVTLELDDAALPLKEDATFTLRPRLFLEGNLFVDVRPGSPSSPEIDYGDYTYPPQQTANTVQLDQVLTSSFQADTRKDLQTFLDQFGSALIDEKGAQSLRVLNKVSPGAYRYTAEVNQALLGEHPHDLSSLIANLDKVVRGLNADPDALANLITNLRITTGSFAAQNVALEQAIKELPNTIDAGNTAFVSLNQAFPSMRAFAREILPGVRTAPETLDAATPLLRQLRLLSRPQELRGLVADLRPTVPQLAKLTHKTIPFMEQTRALSSCFNTVILPWSNDKVSGGPAYDAEHGPQGTVYQETGYGLAGISGESRSGDANGQYIRVIAGGGTNTVQSVGGNGQLKGVGTSPFPIEGAMPAIDDSKKTPFKPKVPCETQEPPNLAALGGAPPVQNSASTSALSAELPPKGEDTMNALEEAAATAKDENRDVKPSDLPQGAFKQLSELFGKGGN
jgi:ABC-type transporter Mla subunit MlaD